MLRLRSATDTIPLAVTPLSTDKTLPRKKRLAGPAIVMLAALVAAGPLIVRGPAHGSDLGFHLVSWMEAQRSMTMGMLYPHWTNSPNFGAGEPRFVFYPPLSWMAGALLGLFLPWGAAAVAMIVTLLAATGLTTRKLALDAMNDGAATLAGCTAIFLGYPLFSAYKRCAFAEMAAGACIPLLLMYALRRQNRVGKFWREVFDGSATPLALVMAGIWLCNGPAGLMAVYLLGAVALVSSVVERSFVPVARAAISTAAGWMLASVYLLPAMWERKWASFGYATSLSHFTIENSWLFANHDTDPTMLAHDILLRRVSWLAVVMVAVTLSSCAICWWRGGMPGKARWWIPLALIAPVVMLLLVPVSEPVWKLAPSLRLLQFPWRWLVVLEPPMAVFLAAAVWAENRKARVAAGTACGVLFLALALKANADWFEDSSEAIATTEQMIQRGMGTVGKPEYAPAGVQMAMVDRMVHGACLLDADSDNSAQNGGAPAWDGEAKDCNSNYQALTFQPEEKHFTGTADHAGFLILRLRYYPAWKLTLNGRPVNAVMERERGFIAVPVAAGPVRVDAEWTTTRDVIVARWMGAAALVLITMLLVLERRLRRGQL